MVACWLCVGPFCHAVPNQLDSVSVVIDFASTLSLEFCHFMRAFIGMDVDGRGGNSLVVAHEDDQTSMC